MFKNIKLLILCSFFSLVGCASIPTIEQMKKDTAGYQLPKLPEEGKAMVYVVRPNVLGGIIRFNVFLDDKKPESEMGYTRAKQYIYFNVSPGEHQILTKAENWAAANINVKPNDIVFLQQNPDMGIVMARNHIHQISDYEGKYHVKRLSLGTIKKLNK
jgi:hypothetical protein